MIKELEQVIYEMSEEVKNAGYKGFVTVPIGKAAMRLEALKNIKAAVKAVIAEAGIRG